MSKAVGKPAAVHRGVEEVDFIVVGAGPNGLGLTAYLAAAGFSVATLEARPELGGGAENVEPEPGYLIDPHATYLYGAAAPIFEQLQLHKYGFRMAYNKNKAGAICSPDGPGFYAGLYNPDSYNEKNMALVKEPMVAEALSGLNTMPKEIIRDFLRSMYWTPPYDESWGTPVNELPWIKYMKSSFPMYDPNWIDMNVVEFCDSLGMLDPLKSVQMFGAWYNGPNPFWKGMAIPGWACNLLMLQSSGVPVGGMHGYMHAVIRCAVAHGARIYANAPVGEIRVEGNRAVGVSLADNAATPNREIRARLGVISGTHVKQTFQQLVPTSAQHPVFREKIKQIDLKGGSLYVLHLLVSELPQYKAFGVLSEEDYPSCVVLNCTTEALLEEMRDVDALRTHPLSKENYVVPICVNEIFDRSRKVKDGYLLSPIYLQVPPPEYHRDGKDAVNRDKEKIADNICEMLCEYSSNITPDKIKKRWINTPRDSEMRNMAFVGGNWYGIRECEDQWWDKRPIPELARYRTPVDGLYLCNHTSYPGGLCLMAVPYNLMHILIEDYGIEMPGWWYPSPWHKTDKEMGARV